MKDNGTPRNHDEAVAKTKRAQAAAADPQASVWVNANAGTGKTHVLTLRVLRLLLSGTSPERILCLTYTKAAAAEMSKRVFDTLAAWVTEDEDALTASLGDVIGRKPLADDIALARTLFTRAIETPGGLKVQTIHAFCERLLQRFPLEASVPPGFKILDDENGRDLKARAIEATLTEATASKTSALGKALNIVIRYAADSNFDELLSKAIAERAWLLAASRIELGTKGDDFAGAEAFLRKTLAIAPGVTVVDLTKQRGLLATEKMLGDLKNVLSGGTVTDVQNSARIETALAALDAGKRGDCLAGYFFKSDLTEPRARLMTTALSRAWPDLANEIQKVQSQFIKLTEALQSAALVEATVALYRLAGAVLQRYTDAKQSSGALDFEDLIERTKNLLSQSSSAEWVLFKLDGGLDHILVDEAQDTSPQQWAIIADLAREFFSGTGASDVQRTVFAVGDEKQSIYSFQGAAPEMFAEMGDRFEKLATDAATAWQPVELHLSFRSTQPVLDAVDAVFADPTLTPGLTAVSNRITHVAKRFGQSGVIEIWPTEVAADVEAVNPWQPLADTSERAPANLLAERIAKTIKGWLDNHEILTSENRRVRAGDILILVRKRNPFAVPMVAALKALNIPVAGADRTSLVDQIAVQDLLALGDFLTLPEDDLALACVLKSPLFGLTDDDLLAIATGRKGTLWKALLAYADDNLRWKPAADTLKRWRAKADFMPPFEFFSSVLDRDGARAKMLHRLGPEAASAIDEFLDVSLSYDDGSPPSLTGFLADLRASNREVKRDMDMARDEVRVMTVHGAKGLEAPIVFLPDTCTTSSGDGSATRLLKMPGVARPEGIPDPIIWPIKGVSKLAAVRTAIAAKDERDRDERNRLLYVAMTRARDRLYVTGFQGRRGRATGCWYDIIADQLTPRMPKVDLGDGLSGWRLTSEQTAANEEIRTERVDAEAAAELPDFAKRRAPHEPQLSVPLAPSRLEAYAPDGDGEPLPSSKPDPAVALDQISPLQLAEPNRFLRGTLTHALLQHLPNIPEPLRARTAEAFVKQRGSALTPAAARSVVKETLGILDSKEFAPLFGPNSRAEVAISAIIPRPRGSGPALRLSGQIDRLAITDAGVLIVDYKTNRPPPREVAQVADAYLFQLAAYVLALGEIYPSKPVRAALLWTDGPRLMEIPSAVINTAIKRLWDLDPASLDAG